VSASSQLGMRVVRAAYVTDFWGNRERFAGLMFTRNSNLRDLGRGFPPALAKRANAAQSSSSVAQRSTYGSTGSGSGARVTV